MNNLIEFDVCIGESPYFTAYFDPRNEWNGWVMPYFDYLEVMKLIQHFNNIEDNDLVMHIVEGSMVFITNLNDLTADVVMAKKIEVNGIKFDAWGIGAGSWCWEMMPAIGDPESVGLIPEIIWKDKDITINSRGDVRNQDSCVLATLPDYVVRSFDDNNHCVIRWSVEDVLQRCDYSINKSQALTVLARLEKSHDRNVGITWDTIDQYVEDIKNDA